MFKHIRNIIRVTWRRCDNVPGTSCKLLAEDFTTYQERVASQLKKMLQRIRNIWRVSWRRVYNVSGTSCKLVTSRKILQRIRNVLHVTWRRCYNISGTSFKLFEEEFTTYQERLASYLQKISQRIRKVLLVTRRRCYNVSWTSVKLVEEEFTTHKERLASYLHGGRCCNVSGTSCMFQEHHSSYLKKMWQRIRNVPKPTPCPSPMSPSVP